LSSLRESLKLAHDVITKGSWGNILIIHHDDADGIISAFLLKKPLEDLGFKVNTVCLEKLYPEVTKMIFDKIEGKGSLVIFTDLGSPHISMISKHKPKDLTVIVVDHHDPESYYDPHIVHINPELYGYSGEKEASASTMSYLLGKEIDPKLVELSFLPIIGSAEIPGPFRGLNLIPLEDALNKGFVREVSHGKYEVLFYGERSLHYNLSSMISTVSSLGYYRGGPEVALKACSIGFKGYVKSFYEEMQSLRSDIFRKGMAIAYRTLKKSKYTQWFHVGKLLYNIGAKALGLLTSQLAFRGRVDPNLYVFGMMKLNPTIPGLGVMSGDLIKISGRLPKGLKVKVESKTMPPLNEIMIKACKGLEGLADGHAYAASGVIPSGFEEKFIEAIDSIVDKVVVS